MKITKRHIGKIVECTFDDHAMNSPLIECTVWGQVVYVDDKCLVVRSWRCNGMADGDSNHENFTVLKVAVKEFRVLK